MPVSFPGWFENSLGCGYSGGCNSLGCGCLDCDATSRRDISGHASADRSHRYSAACLSSSDAYRDSDYPLDSSAYFAGSDHAGG